MFFLGLCVMMKILEYSSGRLLIVQDKDTDKDNYTTDRKKRKRRKCRRKRDASVACGSTMANTGTALCEGAHMDAPPAPDLNSNPSTLLHPGEHRNKLPSDSCGSYTSSQDFDNSDYQWFPDYGYRDSAAGAGNNVPVDSETVSLLAPSFRTGMASQPTSVFSSMSLSLGGPHDFSYDDIAKNLDANLAEIDMENFRTEDIHSILTLPTMCVGDVQSLNCRGEMIASVTGSLIAKLHAFDDPNTSSASPHSVSTQEESGSGTEMSICKSELLFSPVKECAPLPAANISVDSLDCELDGDLLLTCQANKDNYTIAFEGSVALCSEGDSDYHDTTGDSDAGTSESNNCWSGRFIDSSNALIQSELVYTTWSKVCEMQRPESGNNNTRHLRGKLEDNTNSQSLPNLHKRGRFLNQMKTRRRLMSQLSSSMESGRCVKLFDVQTSSSAHSSDSGGSKHSFNLVKLFMKQKSISNDKMSIGGASYDGRHSNSSSGWPSENESYGTETQNNLDNRKIISDLDNAASNNRLDPKLLTNDSDELVTSELQCSTRFYPVAEQNNAKNQQQENNKHIRNMEVINNVFLSSKPTNINHMIEVQRRCHGTQTKRINDSLSPLTCSVEATEAVKQIRTRNVEMNSSPILTRRRTANPIATMKDMSTQIPVHVLDQGIQTSCFADVNTKTSFQLLESPNKTSVVKTIIPNVKPKMRAVFSENTTPAEENKPIFVYYPNYTLPDLTFLRQKQDTLDADVYLLPQQYKLSGGSKTTQPKRSGPTSRKFRPFSCNDIETLKKKGLSHIQDWDSLNVLLPQELKQLLIEDGQGHVVTTSTSSTATPSSGYRGSSTNLTDSSTHGKDSTATYSPLYVYKYDSTNSEFNKAVIPPIPKRSISLTENKTSPPRPPLPRSILRKQERHSTSDIGVHPQELFKRLSLTEQYKSKSEDQCKGNIKQTDVDEGVDPGMDSSNELVAPLTQKKDIINNNAFELWDEKEMLRLRSQVSHFLMEQQSSNQQEALENSTIKKSVSFAQKVLVNDPSLASAAPQEILVQPPNSPNAHQNLGEKLYQCQIPQSTGGESNAMSEEILSVAPEGNGVRLSQTTNRAQRPVIVDLKYKRELVRTVQSAVEQLMSHFSQQQHVSVDAAAHHLALQTLCPALLALVADGLRPAVDTVFGPVPNSAWRLVEASAQQGKVSKALNDLVMKLNSDDLLAEGLMKFNAFIFGLLNVHSLDAWINYLRTRESVLQKHYDPSSFMYLSNSATRNLFDQLVTIIEPLSLFPFKLDLLYERKLLEYSLQRLGQGRSSISPTGVKQWTHKLVRSIHSSVSGSSDEKTLTKHSLEDEFIEPRDVHVVDTAFVKARHQPAGVDTKQRIKASGEATKFFLGSSDCHYTDSVAVKQRPRSCVDMQPSLFSLTDIASTMRKRWSGLQFGSKFSQAFDKLTMEETDDEYTDSLDQPRRRVCNNLSSSPSNSTGDETASDLPRDDDSKLSSGEDKFRRLQMKWELLSGKDSRSNTLPVRSRIPRLVSSPIRPTAPLMPASQPSKIPMTKKSYHPPATSVAAKPKQPVKPRSLSRESVAPVEETTKPRPTSLPPRRTGVILHRPTLTRLPVRASNKPKPSTLNIKLAGRQPNDDFDCLVQTLCHRLPSDSGHLSYNEGELLSVVLEVDSRWLLCCRGDQKGLVPKNDIIYIAT